MKQGPLVTALTQRLQQCPHSFLAPPQMGNSTGGVNVAALVSDLLLGMGYTALTGEEAAEYRLQESPPSRNYLGLVMLSCWLLSDQSFQAVLTEEKVRQTLSHKWLRQLGAQIESRLFYSDGIRREELVRVLLHLLELQPQGESENYSLDRLKTLDSLEEKMILEQTREARERVLEIRRALAQKAAEEAASKMTRE